MNSENIIRLENLVDAEKGCLVDGMPLSQTQYRVYEIEKIEGKISKAILIQDMLTSPSDPRRIDIGTINGKRASFTWINEGNEDFAKYDKFLGEYRQ